MTGRVIVLSPSSGLGGGIERYTQTLEWAFAAAGIVGQRLDLIGPGARAHAGLLDAARTAVRADPQPVRLVAMHPALLPVATLLAREPSVSGVSVICHGCEMWQARWRPRRNLESRLMRRQDVRVVAVSSFTAGTLLRGCRATVLPPGLSRQWFDDLAGAGAGKSHGIPGIRLLTAFRLAAWREKGLPELVAAIAALARPDVSLTVCGSGAAPIGLQRLVAGHPWCTVRSDLGDGELAAELAAADLFVLATRTRAGRLAYGEGFGLVLLESQVAGTPVLAPAYGGSHGAFLEGVTGTAPSDESAEALAGSLDELLKDPLRLAWMGNRAAQWAREAFEPDRYAPLVVRRLL
jgi:phosphatidylinositol alpha-1,6-mannosyltransferase